MADSKDLNGASPNSNTRLTNLSAAEHERLKDDMKKIDEEVQRQTDQVLKVADKWFLSHFRVDCHQKTVQEREINAEYMSAVLQQLPTIGDARSADDIPSIKISFDNRIKSITEDIERMAHVLGKTHMPNFLSYKLGAETIVPNTSAINGFPQPYFGVPMDSYPGRPSPPSPLNGRSTLSMAGLSANDPRPSGPPSDRPAPYAGQSGITQSPLQGSQALLNTAGESGNSTGPSSPLTDRPAAQVGPSGAPEITRDPPSAEGQYKDSRPPKPQESKRSHVPELVWPIKAKPSVRSHPHSTQKEKVKFTFNITKCDKIFDELLKHGNIKLSHIIPSVEQLKGRVYCKWHDSFLHNTNDCAVFRRQIQSAINEGRLRFQKEVKIDRPPVPVTTLEPTSKKTIIRPCAADKSKNKNIVIGDPRTPNMSRRMVTLKAPDKRKTGGTEGQARSDTRSRSPVLRMSDDPGTKAKQSETGADSPNMMVGRSADGQKQQPQTIGPQRSNTRVLGNKTLLRRLDDSVESTLLLVNCLPNI
jgi:hypothetical protein